MYAEGQFITTVHPIVMEASNNDERRYMRSMSKQDAQQINANLFQKLYQSTLSKNQCDFGDIPKSEGDIEKVKAYNSTVECLDVLEELLQKNRLNEPIVNDVRLAISNLILLKPWFRNGFKLKEDWVILTYNTTVMAVLDAVSMLIAEYMNYMIGPIKEPFRLTGKTDKGRGLVSIETLRNFNQLVKNNTMQNTFQSALNTGKQNAIGPVTIAVGTLLGLIAIVNMTRLGILYFYKSRVKMAEYLEMESSFLEANRLSVKASKLPPEERKKILQKQEKVILTMRRLADRLKINAEDISTAAHDEVTKENGTWDFSTIEKDISNNKLNGQMSFNII